MRFLNTRALSPENRQKWKRAVERLYLPILRDPGTSEDAKKRARQKLEAVRNSG
jgi:hypothetical protein